MNLDGAATVDPKELVIVDNDDEEDVHLQEEVDMLRLQVQQSQEALARLQSEEQEKKERKRSRREKLERERLELLGVAKRFQESRSECHPSRQSLQDKAAELAARQLWDGARHRQQVTGLTIGGIRELPGMTSAVKDWITKLQSSVP